MGAYYCAKTIEKSINSIIQQTFTDWELIICDDGSTDGTCNIVEKYKDIDTRIILIKNKKNMKTLEFIKLNESGANNVVASLQQLLADFQVYYTNLRGFHWNIKGHDFFVLHSQFEKMYDDTAEKVDEIAETLSTT